MNNHNRRLSLYQPVIYRIKVPGQMDESWSAWAEDMAITVNFTDDGLPITTIICTVDQAALQGLLRRLYALGLPLISVYSEVIPEAGK